MSYSEKDGQVVLTISYEDYECLLLTLGIAAGNASIGQAAHLTPDFFFRLVNRLNEGNPNFRPYPVDEKRALGYYAAKIPFLKKST